MTPENCQHVTVQDGERTIGEADVRLVPDQDSLHVSLSVDAGQLPPGTRTQLVDAVLDLPEMTPGTQLRATLPAGDGEMLDQIRNRLTDVMTRQAGASLIVEATVKDDRGARGRRV